jgi:dipeptidyl aminopeptidase/acylaminoacyl peptidase
MVIRRTIILVASLMVPLGARAERPSMPAPQQVSFPSGNVTLRGTLCKPPGEGPFPALIYSHGSAPGKLNDLAFEQLGPLFAERGWVFFAPYRRGTT